MMRKGQRAGWIGDGGLGGETFLPGAFMTAGKLTLKITT